MNMPAATKSEEIPIGSLWLEKHNSYNKGDIRNSLLCIVTRENRKSVAYVLFNSKYDEMREHIAARKNFISFWEIISS